MKHRLLVLLLLMLITAVLPAGCGLLKRGMIPFNEPITGEARAGKTLTYTFRGEAGQHIFLNQLDCYRQVSFTLTGPGGLEIFRATGSPAREGLANVGPVALEEKGTYKLAVELARSSDSKSGFEFILWLVEPLIIEGGVVEFNRLTTGESAIPGQMVKYTFEGMAGQTIIPNFAELSRGSNVRLTAPDGLDLFDAHQDRPVMELEPVTLNLDGTYILTFYPSLGNHVEYSFTMESDTDRAVMEGGIIEVDSIPAGARVLIDGADRGETPLTLQLPAGTYAVAIRLAGFPDAQRNVTVESGGRQLLTVQFGDAVNQPPVAQFTCDPASPAVNQSVTFDGSGSYDPDGSIVSYAWDFGGGSTAGGPTAAHTFNAAGTHTVRLTVTDNRGETGTSTRQVTVTDPAPQAHHSIHNIILNPPSPATLGFNDRVEYTFDYTTTHPREVRVFGHPMRGDSLAAAWEAHIPQNYPPGSGSGSGWFTITGGAQTIDQVYFHMFPAVGGNILDEFYLDVSYSFEEVISQAPRMVLGASIGSDGRLISSTGEVRRVHMFAGGMYLVEFDRDVSDCAVVATSITGAHMPQIISARASGGGEVWVFISSAAGDPQPGAFDLQVVGDRPADPRTLLFARIAANGRVLGSSGGVGATRTQAGVYRVQFDRPISGRAMLATSTTGPHRPQLVTTVAGIRRDSTWRDSVIVYISNADGNHQDGSFHISIVDGSAAAAHPAVLFAKIASDGTAANSPDVVSAARTGTGAYRIRFNQDVSDFALLATSGGQNPQLISTTAGMRYNHTWRDTVVVHLFNADGSPQDGPFDLILTGP